MSLRVFLLGDYEMAESQLAKDYTEVHKCRRG